ncbi:aspartate/glutamate racemase family protein [Ruixingdingia sedimenti]|uniref:Aspartate/glutamate racemase family protein n=1 Tax=Ruixingdingia sedimenti TaxID=3073604 RepID=A0ABU1F5S0_9RHOB|nr:aspartate/glutamate racemase family protein [Xinfangfangia sp. LG-4]MDR5652206.1 aspartate/glutamate racemase family protein [Xinfangfangia sp. LG-4]
MRIWFQSTVEIDSYHAYRQALLTHFSATAPGVEVHLAGVPGGTWAGLANSQVMNMPYAYHRILSNTLFEQLRLAEREGYDAFVLGSFTEPWLRELRSMTDMPVVSTAEAAVHLALSVSQKFGLVTMNTENEWFQRINMAARGLQDRIAGYYVVRPEATELEINRIFEDARGYIDRFTAVARQAIADGADAIIPSEGLVATVMAVNGLRSIDDVPVVDPIAGSVLMAEMLAKMHRATGLMPGRRWHYVKTPAHIMDHMDRMRQG